jgi:hypothetical protein
MTLLTAKQHRILAANILKNAGKPGHRSKKQSAQQAQHHLNMAIMIEHRPNWRRIRRHAMERAATDAMKLQSESERGVRP